MKGDEYGGYDSGVYTKRPQEIYRDSLLRLGIEFSWICIYCQKQGSADQGPDGRSWHVDHFFPTSKGGDSLPDNLILSCATCNLSKNHRLASEILREIKNRLALGKIHA